jgi:hypothetical protein
MADIDPELVYAILTRIQETQAAHGRRLEDVFEEMRTINAHVGAILISENRHDADLASLALRVERIERRLNLIDD